MYKCMYIYTHTYQNHSADLYILSQNAIVFCMHLGRDWKLHLLASRSLHLKLYLCTYVCILSVIVSFMCCRLNLKLCACLCVCVYVS